MVQLSSIHLSTGRIICLRARERRSLGSEAAMSNARIESTQGVLLLAEDERLVFGRSSDCTLCLDPEDTGISRLAGAIEFEHGTWWIANSSRTRPLVIIDDLGF